MSFCASVYKTEAINVDSTLRVRQRVSERNCETASPVIHMQYPET